MTSVSGLAGDAPPLAGAAAFRRDFAVLSQAGVGVVLCRTREPFRAMEALREQAFVEADWSFRLWLVTDGWITYRRERPTEAEAGDGAQDPMAALKAMTAAAPAGAGAGQGRAEAFGKGVYVMMYPHHFIARLPPMMQLLKTYATLFSQDKRRLVLLAPPGYVLPPELEDDVVVLDFEVPGQEEMADTLDWTLAAVPAEKRPRLTPEERGRLVSAMAGMTAHEAATAVSRAVVTHKARLPAVPADLLGRVLLDIKTEVVRRSEVLELMPAAGMSEVGGLENLKAWVSKRSRCFGEEARAFGIEPPKGIALIGPPGCLAGSTVINLRRGRRNHGRGITIAEAYNKLHGHDRYSGAQWQPGLDCYVPALLDDRIGYHRVVDIVMSGRKETFVVATEEGHVLRCTAEHPFKVPEGTEGADLEGFKPLRLIQPGDKVIVRSSEKYQGGRKPNKERRTVYSIPYHPHGHKNVVAGRDYKRTPHARIVLEARMNGLSVDELIHVLRHDKERAGSLFYIDPAFEVHHMDENPLNDDPGNLMVVSKEEHLALHADENQKNFGDVLPAEATVAGIRRYGEEMTYDLVMADPFPNYVAQGFVVHNTGKSLAGKAIASSLGLPLVRFDVGRVFNSLVGSSEQRVRSATKMIEAMAPCVAMVDEVDKVFQGQGGGGDSGVSSRVLGALLTWMQETRAPVFLVVTANRVANMPAEFLRRGRLDEVFSVSVPDEAERLEILRIHLRKRNKDPAGVEGLAHAAEASNGYVPSELEAAVKDALIEAFHAGTPLTGELIREQLGNMVPLSEAFAEDFKAMQSWAEGNARPAGGRPPAPRDGAALPASRPRRRSSMPGGGGERSIALDG